MKIGQKITPASDDPMKAFFTVVKITRNGWLHCRLHSYHDGKRGSADCLFKFRASEMKEAA